ncbi:hypothetical protein [Pseudoduganella lutea]|uniref:Uncharacterized protein n=1 Tax=Pseudoduganella lutea TaxID=321985 RepID=A0A4P6L0E4_9BURK|nr:hypothetical protein [Pseudoduganella lutea]QBE64906.1 hypothetical protein EWM63_19480 [Pseudoduganella lutea]
MNMTTNKKVVAPKSRTAEIGQNRTCHNFESAKVLGDPTIDDNKRKYMNVTLESVTIDNFEVLMDMELPPEQARFLASNASSIAQAHYYADWRPRAIYCDGSPAGFDLYDVTGNDEQGHYAI